MRLRNSLRPAHLEKVPSGITGFDEITGGGVPKGRPTLLCGGPGCGKSLFATEFLIRGAMQYGEAGVMMTFEETADEITKNVSSLGFDVKQLISEKLLVIDHVRLEPSEIEENGDYDLEGLFIRLDFAVKAVNAKRVVLDTVESLFGGLANEALLRAELRRLFGWLKERGLTTIITGERGDRLLTRQGLEEYVSDCVVLLDLRVTGQISTRRMRVVKYRGSAHGTNEYPFLIDEDGLSVLPLTSAGLHYPVSEERVTSGVKELDEMLGGNGFFRGSTVLLSGTAGTGKTSLGAHLADATCRRGERCMFFSFEESPAQIVRNMRSIGINLARHVKKGLLQFQSSRPTLVGLEMHLVRMHKLIDAFSPLVVIIDPISNLQSAGTLDDSTNLLIRLLDYLRKRNILGFLITLTGGGKNMESTEEGMSSMVDTWLLLRDIEVGGERNRAMYVLKSRGMAHSNQVREFRITSRGVKLVQVYLGPLGILTGSARLVQEAKEHSDQQQAEEAIERNKLALVRRRKAVEDQISRLRGELNAEEEELRRTIMASEGRRSQLQRGRLAMSVSRGGERRNGSAG